MLLKKSLYFFNKPLSLLRILLAKPKFYCVKPRIYTCCEKIPTLYFLFECVKQRIQESIGAVKRYQPWQPSFQRVTYLFSCALYRFACMIEDKAHFCIAKIQPNLFFACINKKGNLFFFTFFIVKKRLI